jgi:pimeloyl-ACP methyl ester carboxylesterase
MKQEMADTRMKTSTRLVVWAALIIVTVLLYSIFAPPAKTSGATWEHLQAGPYTVDYLEIDIPDHSYPPGKNSTDTLLPFSIWYPVVTDGEQAGRNPDSAGFPVILMCPGFNAGHDSYATLLAYLAGHGFVVGSFPSRGGDFTAGDRARDHAFREVHLRHLDMALKQLKNIPSADAERIGVMGHSFGGPSALVYALRNGRVKAVVSLDGSDVCRNATTRTAANFPEYSPQNLTVPFMLLLADRNYCTGPNRSLDFYDGLKSAPSFVLNFPELSHDDFAFTAGRPEDPAAHRSCEIAGRYVLDFFKAFLKNDSSSLAQLGKSAEQSGYPVMLIGIESKNLKHNWLQSSEGS